MMIFWIFIWFPIQQATFHTPRKFIFMCTCFLIFRYIFSLQEKHFPQNDEAKVFTEKINTTTMHNKENWMEKLILKTLKDDYESFLVANEMTTKRSFVISNNFHSTLTNKNRIQLWRKSCSILFTKNEKLWNVNFTNRMLNRCKIKGSVFTIF